MRQVASLVDFHYKESIEIGVGLAFFSWEQAYYVKGIW